MMKLTFVASKVSAGAFPLLAPNGSASAPSYASSTTVGSGMYFISGSAPAIVNNTQQCAAFYTTGVQILSTGAFQFSSGVLNAASDLLLRRSAAATLQLGTDVNGAAVAQTLKAHDGITGTDVAGANLTLAGGRGTGSGTPGNVILSVATELATGTTAQTLAAILTLSGGNNASVRNHLLYTAPTADLAMTASTEAIGAVLGGTSTYTREWATGALALQRENYIQAPTYAFVGASTLSDAVTFAVSGPPVAGANATLTRKWIATFGALEATVTTPVAGVGIFNAGTVDFVIRDTTANMEAFFQIGGSNILYFGTKTNAPITFWLNDGAASWTMAAAGGLTSGGNYRFAHGTSALATNATEGFFHIQSMAGSPSGTPASIPSGQIPMVFDTTNSRLYIYHGGAWHYIAQTA